MELGAARGDEEVGEHEGGGVEDVGILVSYIHWRRLHDKMKEIPEDSAARFVHRHAQAQYVDNNRWLSTTKPGRLKDGRP